MKIQIVNTPRDYKGNPEGKSILNSNLRGSKYNQFGNLGNLVSLCMKTINSVIVVRLYYGFFTIFFIGLLISSFSEIGL